MHDQLNWHNGAYYPTGPDPKPSRRRLEVERRYVDQLYVDFCERAANIADGALREVAPNMPGLDEEELAEMKAALDEAIFETVNNHFIKELGPLSNEEPNWRDLEEAYRAERRSRSAQS